MDSLDNFEVFAASLQQFGNGCADLMSVVPVVSVQGCPLAAEILQAAASFFQCAEKMVKASTKVLADEVERVVTLLDPTVGHVIDTESDQWKTLSSAKVKSMNEIIQFFGRDGAAFKLFKLLQTRGGFDSAVGALSPNLADGVALMMCVSWLCLFGCRYISPIYSIHYFLVTACCFLAPGMYTYEMFRFYFDDYDYD